MKISFNQRVLNKNAGKQLFVFSLVSIWNAFCVCINKTDLLMKTSRIFLLAAIVALISFSFTLQPAQTASSAAPATKLRNINNQAFKRGEKLKYRIHYGVIDAGIASLEVANDTMMIAKRPTLHVIARGFTNSVWDKVYMVRDKYESYIDEQAILPWYHIRRVNEGGYKIEHDIAFNHFKKEAIINKIRYATDTNTQDMISALYYARTLDFSSAKKGDLFTINTFFDFENYPLKLKYMGTQIISTSIGKINCYKFHPVMEKGRIFKTEEDMTVWISADANKIPVRLQTDILVGAVKMDLIEYSGLVATLNKVK